MSYSKRHNKFLFPLFAESIYGSFCKAENEISNVVNYHPNTLGRAAQGLTVKRVLSNFIKLSAATGRCAAFLKSKG